MSCVPVVSADRALVTCLDTEEHTLMPELYVANWISEHIAVCLGGCEEAPPRSALWHVTCVGHTPVPSPEGPSSGSLLQQQQGSRGLGMLWFQFTDPGVTCPR